MSGVDVALLILIGLSVLVGFWRGLLKEVLSLVIWGLAIVLAYHYSGVIAGQLEHWISQPSIQQVVAFFAIFLFVVIVGGLLLFLLSRLVKFSGLSGTDRLLGALFGAARGAALIVILIVAAGLTPLGQDPWFEESRVVAALTPVAEELKAYLPLDAGRGEETSSPRFDPVLK